MLDVIHEIIVDLTKLTPRRSVPKKTTCVREKNDRFEQDLIYMRTFLSGLLNLLWSLLYSKRFRADSMDSRGLVSISV